MKNLLSFLHIIGHMKRIERFKDMPFWKNTDVKRWDSNAEHSYRMAMMAILLLPKLEKKYDVEKLLKIILIHDLVEILIDDKFPFKTEGKKYSLPDNFVPDDPEHEIKAFEKLTLNIDEKIEYLELLKDFINAEIGKSASDEAKFAVALDRIEASLQVVDYIRLSEFEITEEHSHLQSEYLKSKSDIGEDKLLELVDLIEKELLNI